MGANSCPLLGERNDQVKTIKDSIVSAFIFRIIGVWNNEFQNQGCKFLENQNQTKNNGNKEEFHGTLPQVSSPVLQFYSPGTLKILHNYTSSSSKTRQNCVTLRHV